MKILVSNDDGIQALGIKALVKELAKIGEVIVAAPLSERSANSHSITIEGKLKVKEVIFDGGIKGWAIDGTPADCVHLAIKALLKDKPDIIVSGINQGFNLASDCVYSGTVAAAREGFILGIPSIAISLDSRTSTDFSFAAYVARKACERFVLDPHNREYMLNINVPSVSRDKIRGYKVCEFAGIRDYNERYNHYQDDDFHYFEIGDFEITTASKGEDLIYDVNALMANYVTITPLYIDLVNHRYLDKLADLWEEDEF